MAKCENCGETNPDGSKYCSNCGSLIIKAMTYEEIKNPRKENTKEDPSLHYDKKSVLLAFMLSFIVYPGIGEMYTRAYKSGIMLFAAMTVFLFLGAQGTISIDAVGVFIIGGIIAIISGINAAYQSSNYNLTKHKYMAAGELMAVAAFSIGGATINFSVLGGAVVTVILLIFIATSDHYSNKDNILLTIIGCAIGLVCGYGMNELLGSYILSLFN